METLDLLIEKFHEFEDELNKSSDNDTEENSEPKENLEKYISAFQRWGPAKINTPPAKPAATSKPKLTGSDKIAAVSKEPIKAIDSKVNKPAKLTGLDRIKAESQKPITSMDSKVAKDEGFKPSFKGHKAALGVGAVTNASGVTTDTNFNPMTQKVSSKKYINVPSEKLSMAKNGQWNLDKTINNSYGDAPNGSSPMAMSEKLSCSENGQWNLNKDGLGDAIKQLKSSTKVTSAMNTLRAGPKAPMLKDEKCPKCHASPCECQTTGINVD